MEKYNRQIKTLNITEKLKVIEAVEVGVKRKKDITSDFGSPACTLSTIIRNKDKILQAADEGTFSPDWKRNKLVKFPELEKVMTEWMKRARDCHLEISRPIVQEKATQLATKLGLTFQASDDWLTNFEKRRNRRKNFLR